jgi:small subunit ribosomal protein S16
MAVKIRMQRGGATHNPHYRVVVTDVRSRRDGRFVEKVGTYDPKNKDQNKQYDLNLDRVDYWLSVGAQPSDTVRSLIKKVRRETATVVTTDAPVEAVAPDETPAAPVAEAAPATEEAEAVVEETAAAEEAPVSVEAEAVAEEAAAEAEAESTEEAVAEEAPEAEAASVEEEASEESPVEESGQDKIA